MSLRDKVTKEIGELFAQQSDYIWWEAETTKLTESPIETAFLVALEGMGRIAYTDVIISEKDESDSYFDSVRHADTYWIYVTPQAQIGDYRVDFLISFGAGDRKDTLIVECDGHDFHDRTHFQASRDRERDRFLVSSGHKVFRFTGTDINRRAIECANEVLMFIRIRQNDHLRRQLKVVGT